MKPQEIFLSILGLPLRASTTASCMDRLRRGVLISVVAVSLVEDIVLCLTVLGFTLLVGDSMCEFTVKERNIEFK
ncbi:hypothetical protein BHF30_26720, partial [Escherichia coli]